MTDERVPILTEQPAEESRPTISQGDKLLRIGMMVREMLAEVRRAPVDEEGRKLLRDIHDRAVRELREVLPEDLIDELESVTIPFGPDVPTESELRITQAQLTGWLEGLFHGIQASILAQQMQAQQQLGRLRGQLPGAAEGDRPHRGGYL